MTFLLLYIATKISADDPKEPTFFFRGGDFGEEFD
jgi:hypothetical protein